MGLPGTDADADAKNPARDGVVLVIGDNRARTAAATLCRERNDALASAIHPAAVIRDVEPETTVVGVPAKKI